MNSEEHSLLSQFLDQLKAIRGAAKDPDAERLIARAAAEQPDAVYLLVQKALLQEQGLKAAQGRIEQLQRQLEQARSTPAGAPAGGGFLAQNPWGNPVSRAPLGMGYAPAAPLGPAASGMGLGGGGFGSFLGTAAATAAGVAAGAFLFQGIENLMGHHESGGGAFSDAALNEGHQTQETVGFNDQTGNDTGSPDAFMDNPVDAGMPDDVDGWADGGDDIDTVDV